MPDQPVVGVSWYEAVAFCLWLSSTTGESIMLPTDPQWQYAAQGDDGRAYPWGDAWDCGRCRNSVAPCESDAASIVTAYEGKGDSPFGVVDMAGNVWEWTVTDYDSNSGDPHAEAKTRILRGGSWDDGKPEIFRCDHRNRFGPNLRSYFNGFRVCRSGGPAG
ncbi:MAG: formylglycine-generating enzyme family protein [Chloroflexi bacterium]|nr:formylglycine-generating enzyme family protein [Chloroflexota bacterium]